MMDQSIKISSAYLWKKKEISVFPSFTDKCKTTLASHISQVLEISSVYLEVNNKNNQFYIFWSLFPSKTKNMNLFLNKV